MKFLCTIWSILSSENRTLPHDFLGYVLLSRISASSDVCSTVYLYKIDIIPKCVLFLCTHGYTVVNLKIHVIYSTHNNDICRSPCFSYTAPMSHTLSPTEHAVLVKFTAQNKSEMSDGQTAHVITLSPPGEETINRGDVTLAS